MTLTIVRTTGLATVQDLGRTGRMHEAVPPGGALVPELLVAANRRARNPDDALAIEIFGQLVVRADRDVEVSTDERAYLLDADEELAVGSGPRRATYLAVRGGLVASRGTLLCANLGAPLRPGQRLTADAAREVDTVPPRLTSAGPIRVIAGPDVDAFAEGALAALAAATYRVLPASDRVGTRLAGPEVARRPGFVERSRPMVRGALEVPGDGQPIVLGPEHPTTGGYPILAVIATAELGRFFSIAPGGEVRFAVQ